MLDPLEDADDDTRQALASVALLMGERLFPRRDTFTTRQAFRVALLKECRAYVQEAGSEVIPDDPQALQVLFEVMRVALESPFVGDLPDPSAH